MPSVFTGEAYPCQMQKNQTFSCLFRHYAKHNGLCKDGMHDLWCHLLVDEADQSRSSADLVFSFVDELLPDQSPETVHLMPQGLQRR